MIFSSKKIRRFFQKHSGPIVFCLVLFFSTETLLQITSFIYRQKKNNIHTASLQKETSDLKIMCLGESTTYGDYPIFLSEELAAYNATVIDEGVPGIDTTYILKNLPELLNQHKPGIALLMLGANDVPESDEGYMRLYAGVNPGFEQKLIKICRTYATIRYLLWHFIFSKRASPKHQTKSTPMPKHYDTYSLGTNVAFLNGGNRNITTRRAEKEIKAIQALKINTKEDCEEFLRDILQRDDIYPEVFFEAFAKVYDNYISRSPDKIKQRGMELLAFAQTLKETKTNLKFQMLTGKEITLTYRQTNDIIKKVLALSPHDPYATCFKTGPESNYINAQASHPLDYIQLTSHMIHVQQYKQALQTYKQAIKEYPHLRWVLASMAKTAFIFTGQPEQIKNLAPYLPEEQLKNVTKGTHGKDVPKMTIKNYNACVDYLLEHGCTVICMQYPMRSVEVLKNMIHNKDKVFFVDNETIFKAAVRQHGFSSIFYDAFAGDFGHCTRKGNRILAQNAARKISSILNRRQH